jgi:hypothetical protein
MWTQEDLDRIDEAIATGALSVRHGDKVITYRSIEDLLKVRERIQRALTRGRWPSRSYVALGSGLK